MDPWHMALVLKPLGLLILFTPGAAFAWLLRKRMRECKMKRLLLVSWKI